MGGTLVILNMKIHETDNFTLYPASILSVNKNRFTKHYFIGDKRVASRIGTGLFNNVYGLLIGKLIFYTKIINFTIKMALFIQVR